MAPAGRRKQPLHDLARRAGLDVEVDILEEPAIGRLCSIEHGAIVFGAELIDRSVVSWLAPAFKSSCLVASTTQARAVIERLIVGRIKFTLRQNEVSDEVDGYAFEAVTRFDHLFTGIAVERPRNLDPMDRTGLDEIRPEDTMDAEYSQVLEQAYRKSSVVGSVPKGCGGCAVHGDAGHIVEGVAA